MGSDFFFSFVWINYLLLLFIAVSGKLLKLPLVLKLLKGARMIRRLYAEALGLGQNQGCGGWWKTVKKKKPKANHFTFHLMLPPEKKNVYILYQSYMDTIIRVSGTCRQSYVTSYNVLLVLLPLVEEPALCWHCCLSRPARLFC